MSVYTKTARKKPKRKAADVDENYKAWIRTLPCICCVGWTRFEAHVMDMRSAAPFAHVRQASRTEAAHVGDHAAYRLASDRTCIPLCAIEHHREGPDSHHKLSRKFWAAHGLDRNTVIAFLNQHYERLHGGGHTTC